MNKRIRIILYFILFFIKNYVNCFKLNEFSPFLRNINVNQSDNGFYHHLTKRELVTPNKEYGACKTPNNEDGHCKHVLYCRMPELNNDMWKIISHLCIIEDKSIGICCPDNFQGTSGPQFVPDDTNKNTLNKPRDRGCGITTRKFPEVTSGRSAEPDEWPWMAALIQPAHPYLYCGGVLITDRHVLTAAHCLEGQVLKDVIVRLGEYDKTQINETRFRDFRIRRTIKHVDFDPHSYENDIALLFLDRPTIFTSYIWPICMPPAGVNWEGQNAVVIGWGTQFMSGPFSKVLKEVSVPIWQHDRCVNAFVQNIDENLLCAGDDGLDSCQGDSGGPLMIQLSNREWVVVGVVSWGIRCGEKQRPGLYTRVDKYLRWIIENTI